MASLLSKLDEILDEKYKLKKSVKEDVEILKDKLKSMHVALANVAEVPREQLEEHVTLWDKQVRELTHRTEFVVDIFRARIAASEASTGDTGTHKGLGLPKKMDRLLRGNKARRQIACSIKDIKDQVQDVANRNGWYRDWCELPPEPPETEPAASIITDPSLQAFHEESREPVGLHAQTQDLINILLEGAEESKLELKTLSIVGVGGLGKTTLARAAYEKIKGNFHCSAFVTVGRYPNTIKLLLDILFNLHKRKATISNPNRVLDANQLIQQLMDFLQDKRFLIVIDDMWDKQTWDIIKCALFCGNNLGSRLIVTTRMLDVAQCCSSSDGAVYRMQPLNYDDSKRLFYKRLFSEESDYPEEIKHVCHGILKQCGGLPLAIIAVAGMLCSHNQIKSMDECQTVLKTIGAGFAGNPSFENVMRVLSLSYYSLPSHLKTCFLYLSIFPEDYEIERDRLIRRWMAEGFIHEKQGISLFETGKIYFNELISRGLIQPINVDCRCLVKYCCVHAIMLDLMLRLSNEDNFVTVWVEQIPPGSQRRIRRLSVQSSFADDITHRQATSMWQVKSLNVFCPPAADVLPSLSHFRALRVLDLEYSYPCGSYHQIDLRYVGNLFHLRYLGLKNTTNVRELPMDIGKLQFLQTLDVREDAIIELPSSVIQLRHLMCLHIEGSAVLPAGAGNLTSLEELSKLEVDPLIVEEVGHLRELRVLGIFWGELDESLNETLMESLNKLDKLQSVEIESSGGHIDLMREGWAPPQCLHRFESYGEGSFSTLPRWISPSALPLLSHLVIHVDKVVVQEDIQNLGMLPALRCILLLCVNTSCIEKATVEGFRVSRDAFPSVRECRFYNFVTVPSMFPEGAMPRLQSLGFSFRACDIGSSNLGLGNLPSLLEVHVDLWWQEASETQVEETEAALRHAANAHRNCPTLTIGYSMKKRVGEAM